MPRWWQPFFLLLALPLFTVPATSQLRLAFDFLCERPAFCDMICTVRCPTIPTIATLAPGLLGMLCLGWALSSRPEVRQAGIVATALAVARLLVPAVDILVAGWRSGWTTFEAGTFMAGAFSPLLSPLLWLITLVAFVCYGVTHSEPHPNDSTPRPTDARSQDSSDENFRAFVSGRLRQDPTEQFGPVLEQWRRLHMGYIPLRDSLLRVFDEEQRRASRRSPQS